MKPAPSETPPSAAAPAAPGSPVAPSPWGIVLASALCLFLELALIRYQAARLSLFGYFKNVSLLSAFLGLGIGFTRGGAGGRRLVRCLALIAAQVLAFSAIQACGLSLPYPILENLSMGLVNLTRLASSLAVFAVIGAFFALNALAFVPLGELTAGLMSRTDPVRAYGLNLLGSLAGILAFSACAFLSTPPAVWFAAASAAALWFLREERRPLLAAALLALLVAAVELLDPAVLTGAKMRIYSPYQLIECDFSQEAGGATGVTMSIAANHDYFQRVYDLREKAVASAAGMRAAALREVAGYYGFPYLFRPAPGDVLIVGAGAGNDAAAALRKGAGRVDAVEIDPAIARLGRRYHPEQPYADPRVSLVVDDARAWMRRCGKKYDLVVYGLLDSHVLLGTLSNVRLDSFIYTVEAFREARALLAEDGVLCLSFSLVQTRQGRKIALMLEEAFDGQKPLCYRSRYDGGYTFLAGPGVRPDRLPESTPAMTPMGDRFNDSLIPADPSTDDWPFFYMPSRVYPKSYGVLVAILLAVSAILIRRCGTRRAGGFDAEFFLLGAGFMLIETKGITELGLRFGNTWTVVTFVIAAILVFAFLANALVARFGAVSAGACYALLAALLAAEWLFRISAPPALLPAAAARFYALAVLTLPLFFSGLIFSRELLKRGDIGAALSSNLFGAMAGGFVEYNAMYCGYHSLSGFALALYALAFVVFLARRARIAPPAPARV